MKKTALLLAIVMLSFGFTACTSQPDTELIMQVGELKARVEQLEERVAQLETEAEAVAGAPVAEPESTGAEAAEGAEPAAIAGFSDVQQIVYETAQSYLTNPYYIKVAKDYNSMQVLNALELQIGDFEGEPFHAVLLQVEADRDIHGFAAGLIVVDMKDVQVYDETKVDLSALEDNSIDSYDEKLAYLISAYGSYIDGYNDSIIAGHEIRTELSADEISAINAELSK